MTSGCDIFLLKKGTLTVQKIHLILNNNETSHPLL